MKQRPLMFTQGQASMEKKKKKKILTLEAET